MKLLVGLFLFGLAAAVAYGIYTDAMSRPQRTLSATIVDSIAAQFDHKSSASTPARVTAKLADGTIVVIRGAEAAKFSAGQSVELTEMAAPWGAVWYRPR